MKQLYGILLLGAILTTGFASNALALTAACSTISNQATLTYSDGGGPLSILSDGDAAAGIQTTDFTVDSKVDLTVTTVTPAVPATGVDQVLIYTITNEGNDTQRYMLQLYAGNNGETSGAASDIFNMTSVRVYYDTTPDGVFDGSEIQVGAANPANGADIGLTPDVTGNVGAVPANLIEIYVVSNVPAGRITGDDAIYTLKARTYQIAGATGVGGVLGAETGNSSTTTTRNSCGVGGDVVLADVTAATGGVGTGIADGTTDGDSYSTGYYTVSAATISVAKSQTVLWDPINLAASPVAIPGAYVQYAITVSNTGAASATLSTITDALQAAALDIDPDLITNAGPATPESLAGSGFKVTHDAVGPGGRSTAATRYFTTTSTVDGVDFTVLTKTVTADFTLVLPDETPGTTYTAGELKPDESVTLTFNAIIL